MIQVIVSRKHATVLSQVLLHVSSFRIIRHSDRFLRLDASLDFRQMSRRVYVPPNDLCRCLLVSFFCTGERSRCYFRRSGLALRPNSTATFKREDIVLLPLPRSAFVETRQHAKELVQITA
jgi:hypothetical protein